jgi:ADP-dependent NAD(P)H-hydrate dehydratase / NAD(P)H-hydrate epimerase
MYIYSSKQIKEIDTQAEKMGMSLFTLMENAGNGLYRKIKPLIEVDDQILILAGKGNNGGDGIVLARYLKNNGYHVTLVFPLGEPQTVTAKEHFSYYQACGYESEPFSKELNADWIIDALLGVGSQLPLRKDLLEVTDWINKKNAKVIAIDHPTGVSSDSGEGDEHAIRADYTFSLHGYKPSTFLFPASEHYGIVSVIDIGLPQTSTWKVWCEKDVKMTLPKRTENTHKGTFGTALLIAGSDEMPGSAALAAVGALRFGTGKLSISTSKHASTIIGPLAPEATFLYNLITDELDQRFTSIAIGPGLTPNENLEQTISDILEAPIPIILDAGALSRREYHSRSHVTILTPHPGEFRRLTGKTSKEIQLNRIHLASEYAQKNGVILVLKGKYTVIAFPDGSGYINLTGNSALSKGGTGDTLTGMLLASVGIHNRIKDAVANAVYIHGHCADEWIKYNGEQTMLAHDISRILPEICCQFFK